jgi:hypothetical protein
MRPEPEFQSFEDVWRRYPFAPLVEIALAIALWCKQIPARRPWHLSGRDTNHPQTT